MLFMVLACELLLLSRRRKKKRFPFDMKNLKPDFEIEHFWDRLKEATQTLLLLDFDGTLAPFVVDPAAARPYPETVPLLEQLAQDERTRLVIISGRDIDSLSRCLGMVSLPELWGCHGWQRRLPEGEVKQKPLPAKVAQLMQQAAVLAENFGCADRLEHKAVSLALHWRGKPEEEIARIRSLLGEKWRRLATAGNLQMHAFDGGIELRCTGVDKGTAVTQLLREVEPETFVAYLGDDLTDEDAFRALGDCGLKVLVRSAWRKTAADVWLKPPAELNWFLRQWLICRGGHVGETL